MSRISSLLALAALACLFAADIDITPLDPWGELGRLAGGALAPDWGALYDFRLALLNTLTFAFCGLALGAAGGALLAFFFHRAPVRLFCALTRAVHEIFWAFLFMPAVGLNPLCGILAIALPYAGVFAKVYAEILQEADPKPQRGLPDGTGTLSRFFYATLPTIYADAAHYTAYRFECALRSSAVLGFVGLPTLGFHLETAFREGIYSQAAVLLYAFFFLVASLKYWLRPLTAALGVGASLLLVSAEISFSPANIRRFLTYDIVPWPLRRQGFADGSGDIAWAPGPLRDWLADLFYNQVAPGMWNTVVLSQIALFATGLLTLAGFGFLSRHFTRPAVRRLGRWTSVVLRTTPEYILAYLLVLLWGPSMLPAIAAIALHNGAILAHLTAQRADRISLRLDAPGRRADRYAYEILPRLYGQFLALLFYRWEIIMRESALLGLLGVHTLGFFIDSAFADDRLDRAVLLIACTALLNMAVDAFSQRVRKNLRISSGQVRTMEVDKSG